MLPASSGALRQPLASESYTEGKQDSDQRRTSQGDDTVYEMLHPFHMWAQISALCAIVLAIAAWVPLSIASRGFTSLVAGAVLLCPISRDRCVWRALACGGG